MTEQFGLALESGEFIPASELRGVIPELRAATAELPEALALRLATRIEQSDQFTNLWELDEAAAELRRLHAQVEALSAAQAGVPAGVIAWMYNRVGSQLNPHFIAAGQNADDLRVGRPGIVAPCANHVDWVALAAAPQPSPAPAPAQPIPCAS